jgi:hypothetical protein
VDKEVQNFAALSNLATPVYLHAQDPAYSPTAIAPAAS